MNLRMITPPTAEPLTLAEAKDHLNIAVDDTHLDAWLSSKITAARENAEEVLEVTLTDAIYEFRFDGFYPQYPVEFYWNGRTESYQQYPYSCFGVALPIGNVGTILSVTHLDLDGVMQTLDTATYIFDDDLRAPSIRPAYGTSWPTGRHQPNAVVITFQGIYSETVSPPKSVPESTKQAMLLMISHWNENREAVIVGQTALEMPLGAMYLLQRKRTHLGV